MPSLSSIINRFTDDAILYWERSGDDDSGQALYKPPAELKCRWEDRQQEILMPDGRKVMTRAYLLLSSAVKVQGLVWRGTIASWNAASFYPRMPSVNEGGCELLIVRSTPGIKQLPGTAYEAYL